jgi:phage protein D
MEFEHVYIEIDGQETEDIYPDLISLEVELDDRLAGMFRIRLPMAHNMDGTWSYLDDERFTLWKPVTIKAGFKAGMDDLISGYITHVNPTFDPDLSQSLLEIWGMDESVIMDREEKLKDWPNKKDSDIATEIFDLYGFTPDVEDTPVVHDEALSTVIQRETDMRFLQRLAQRNGYECGVENGAAYFGKPKLDESPQPVLAYFFGNETNLDRFAINVDGLVPANVAMFGVDRLNKKVADTFVETGQHTSLGEKDGAAFLTPKVKPAKITVAMNAVTGKPEMEELCRAYFHKAQWFVTAEGEIVGNFYGHALKAGKTVTIKGIGETYSGVYFVTHVTHSFTGDGYTQSFKVKRNALMPKGTEDFS